MYTQAQLRLRECLLCAQNMDAPTTYARETTKEIKKNIYIQIYAIWQASVSTIVSYDDDDDDDTIKAHQSTYTRTWPWVLSTTPQLYAIWRRNTLHFMCALVYNIIQQNCFQPYFFLLCFCLYLLNLLIYVHAFATAAFSSKRTTQHTAQQSSKNIHIYI